MTAPNTAENVCRGTPSQSAQVPYSRLSSTSVSPTSSTTAATTWPPYDPERLRGRSHWPVRGRHVRRPCMASASMSHQWPFVWPLSGHRVTPPSDGTGAVPSREPADRSPDALEKRHERRRPNATNPRRPRAGPRPHAALTPPPMNPPHPETGHYETAGAIQESNPDWLVRWGVHTRHYVAFPLFPPPARSVIQSTSPEGLLRRMRQAELAIRSEASRGPIVDPFHAARHHDTARWPGRHRPKP